MAARGLLPESILTRPKMGFPVPFGRWARGAWNSVVHEVLLDRRTRERGVFDASAVAALLRDHHDGRRNGGDAIWALLNLELWYRTFIDRAGAQTLPLPHRQIGRSAHTAPQGMARRRDSGEILRPDSGHAQRTG